VHLNSCFSVSVSIQVCAASSTGIHVNSQTVGGWTALHEAAGKCHTELVDLFIKRGAYVDACTKTQHFTALHVACRKPVLEVCEELCNRFVIAAPTI